MRVLPYYRLIFSILPLKKISLPNYRYLFLFLQQSLSGMRYIHYAPTHVLYNHRKIDPTCSFNCCSSDSLRAFVLYHTPVHLL